jgi:glutathione S-transferase
MKLYDFKRAPNPRRVRMFLAEKGLEIETIQVDLGAKAQFDEPFRSINPRCTVPALELDDGSVLSENASIVRYIEELYPDPPLLGVDAKDKAMVAEWTARVEWEGLLGVAEALRNTSSFFENAAITGQTPYQQIPELAERGLHRAQAFFQTLDERLCQEPYLAGDQLSVADIIGFVFVDFSRTIKIKPSAELTHLNQWREAIAARPSASA